MKISELKGKELDAYTERLMRQVEAEGLLPAPVHMKQEILKRSERLDYQIAVQTRQIPKKLQLFFYSLKVGAAVVTALFLLFTVPKEMPDMGIEQAAVRQEQSIGNKLNQGLRTLDELFAGRSLERYFREKTED